MSDHIESLDDLRAAIDQSITLAKVILADAEKLSGATDRWAIEAVQGHAEQIRDIAVIQYDTLNRANAVWRQIVEEQA